PVLPDDPGQAVQAFQPDDTSAPKMWASHPSNYDREVNAQRRYVRSPIDDRSPWVLFENGPVIREKVTRLAYGPSLPPDAKLETPEMVQEFIDEEHSETTYDPRYHGLHDHRYITPGN